MTWVHCCFASLLGVALAANGSQSRPAGVTCNSDYGVYNTSVALTMQTLWDDQTAAMKKNLAICGYDRLSWDGPLDCFVCWSKLSKDQKNARLVLGTDAACHDQLIMSAGFNCTTPSEGTGVVQKRPAGVLCDSAMAIYNTSLNKVNQGWAKLSPKVRDAAAKCGFSKKTWDGPSACRACFADLSKAKQKAILALGTDAACANTAMKPFGVDCGRLMRDMPDAAKRSAFYANLSQATLQQKFKVFHRALKGARAVGSSNSFLYLAALVSVGLLSSCLGLGVVSRGTVGKAKPSLDVAKELAPNDEEHSADELEMLLRVDDHH